MTVDGVGVDGVWKGRVDNTGDVMIGGGGAVVAGICPVVVRICVVCVADLQVSCVVSVVVIVVTGSDNTHTILAVGGIQKGSFNL